MSCDDQCLSGVLHEGNPTGTLITLGTTQVYVTRPTEPIPKKAILVLPDIYGIKPKNIQLISDQISNSSQVMTYLIDYLNDDPVPLDAKHSQSHFSLPDWRKHHGPQQTRPVLNQVIEILRKQGVVDFAAIGYCFGGRYVFDLAHENVLKVGATSHPSRLENPKDIQTLLESSRVPMLINSCETDAQFSHEFQKNTDDILGDGKYKPGYKRNYYPGASHGFGCRADLSNPQEKKAVQDSTLEIIQWFNSYL